MNESGDLTRAEFYDRLKGQIEHEDELINIRVVWQLLAQSFLFSTYATLLNAKGEAKSQLLVQQQEFLLWAVPIVALIAGMLASISIYTSIYTIEDLGSMYRKFLEEQRADKDRTTRLFPPHSRSGRNQELGKGGAHWAAALIRFDLAGNFGKTCCLCFLARANVLLPEIVTISIFLLSSVRQMTNALSCRMAH